MWFDGITTKTCKLLPLQHQFERRFMRIAFTVLLTVHAIIHLIGFLKAFGIAKFSSLTLSISKPLGIAWLISALAFLGATAAFIVAPRLFWLFGAIAIVVSQIVIASSFSDAKFGTLINIVILLVVVFYAFSVGPFGLRATYENQVRQSLKHVTKTPNITDEDLKPFPKPLQRYLRFVGVVGKPQVNSFRVRFTGRIRAPKTLLG
jgi:hypothetical protein